jgi:hypothetical protein
MPRVFGSLNEKRVRTHASPPVRPTRTQSSEAGARHEKKVLRGCAKSKDGNLILIGTVPVPHSEDKSFPRERKDKRHLVRQDATIFKKEMVGWSLSFRVAYGVVRSGVIIWRKPAQACPARHGIERTRGRASSLTHTARLRQRHPSTQRCARPPRPCR